MAIPPLRERGSDTLLLAGHFLEINRMRLGVRSLRLSPEAEEALLAYAWPGNVRELEHVISRAAIKALSQGARRDDIITLIPEWLDLPIPKRRVDGREAEPEVSGEVAPRSLRERVETSQRQAIRNALETCDGSWAAAARYLVVDPSNLHKLAQRLGLK